MVQHAYMRVAPSALTSTLRSRGFVVFGGAAALVSSCVVYTPDLLHDDAVSLGGRPGPTASPGSPAPTPTLPRGQLERQGLAPEQLGAFVAADPETVEWLFDGGKPEGPDAGSADAAAP